ncbi:MAG: hypothetical protein L0229_21730 [Blastocatellia bacterium]|nr:hypothetical protein [Blastocatellia bacterium]
MTTDRQEGKRNRAKSVITNNRKFLIGGLGALAPAIISLLVADLSAILLGLTFLVCLGAFIKVVLLFCVGGFVAYLHKEEKNPVRIFELGILAPALITGILNANNVSASDTPIAVNTKPAVSATAFTTMGSQSSQDVGVEKFSLPKETWSQQIYRGVTGSVPDEVWFVIVGEHTKLEDAKAQAASIASNAKWRGFRARVFAPYGKEKPGYSVVIGANLTLGDARRLQQKAIDAGFPESTKVWSFAKGK